jgi:hypothetical protein
MACAIVVYCLLSTVYCLLSTTANAQLLKKSDYGAGITVAVYQFDDARSKKFGLVTKLKQTFSTPEDEVEHITRNYGVEDLKLRHVRPSVGLKEGENFTDTQPMNEKPFTFTITPRLITREEVSFDFTAKYGNQVLMEFTSISANNYETGDAARRTRRASACANSKGRKASRRAGDARLAGDDHARDHRRQRLAEQTLRHLAPDRRLRLESRDHVERHL